MKKTIALILAFTMLLSLCACGAKAPSQSAAPSGSEAPADKPERPEQNLKSGLLSMLNMTEEEYGAFKQARNDARMQMTKEGYTELPTIPEDPDAPGPAPDGAEPFDPGMSPEKMGMPSEAEMLADEFGIVYYDTLDAMLMGLYAGDVGSIEIYQSVARFLCATNQDLMILGKFDLDKETNTFAELALSGILSNDFAFLMMEENSELCEEFNSAITAMKADGTLEKLVAEQIDGLVDGGEITPVTMPVIDGAETVKIAVTGALPPMDFVDADGTPAGFNTAVLAEISRRINKNIELLVVDSIGRAAALASGTVDAVFWTRTNSAANNVAEMSEAERSASREELKKGLSEEEIQLLERMEEIADFSAYGAADMPEGTIATVPYFSDVIVPVELRRDPNK